MLNTVNTALTALRAFDRKSEVIANNIANVNTDGFRKSRAVLEEESPAGVQVTVERMNTPEDTVTLAEAETAPSNVNLDEELIAFIVNRHHYAANIETVKTADEMQGILLDILR